ncbi:hypothetical protein CK203_075073 [Vitis vinifera]|uniref:Uncharacterized protein n=1 Tax=Vitis vinifera TaxID=29760 RepID=A0A438F9P4_VITVI|nr:hypothetical protein CK203_075073 [Vitis vinifera]
MSINKEVASSGPTGDAPEKSVDKLSRRPCHYFLKGGIQCRAPIPSTGAVQGVSSFYLDPTILHPPQYRPGADGMQHSKHAVQLDLSLLEVLFVYSLKKGKNDIFSMAAHLPSLQLVTELPDSTKGGAKGYVVVGVPGRAIGASGEAFFSKLLIGASGYVSLREAAKEGSAWGALHSERPSFLQGGATGDAEKRRALLDDRERRKGGNLAEGSGKKRFRFKRTRTSGDLNHSGPSISAAGPFGTCVEEATSINRPSSPHPDADVAEASCAAVSPPVATQWRKWGQKTGSAILRAKPSCPCTGEGAASRRPSSARNLKSGLLGGFKIDSRRPSNPFSYAELEEKLKQIPPGSTTAMPSAKMFEVVETLVSGLRGMAQQHDLFTDLLRTTDYMKAFASQQKIVKISCA